MEKIIEAHMSPESGLTPACRRVFEHKAVGETEQQIAEFLHRQTCTINTQAGHFLAEMGCKNIQEAVALAIAEGWLTFKFVTKKLAVLLFINIVAAQSLTVNHDQDQRRGPQVRRVRTIRTREQIS